MSRVDKFKTFKQSMAEIQMIPRRVLDAFYDCLVNLVINQLKEEGKFRLPGIGTIHIYERAGTTKTLNGKTMEVAPRKALKIVWSKTIKKALI